MTPTQLEAILAEREGILRMVNDTQIPTRRHAPGNTDVSWNDACRQIADDIRNRPTPASEEPPAVLAHELVPERYGEPLNDFGVDGWLPIAGLELDGRRVLVGHWFGPMQNGEWHWSEEMVFANANYQVGAQTHFHEIPTPPSALARP